MHAPAPSQILAEVDLLRIKVAHLEFQLAQLQAQMQLSNLNRQREELIRTTLAQHVGDADADQYVIDLDAGVIRPRTEEA
jgi:hypothetical protein